MNGNAQQKLEPLTLESKEKYIRKLVELVDKNYVDPEKASKLTAKLEKNLQTGLYSDYNDQMAFFKAIEMHCTDILKDAHFSISHNPELVAEILKSKEQDTLSTSWTTKANVKNANYGFEKLQRLKGNIGYVDLRTFYPLRLGAGKIIAHALNFFQDTNALILDLRKNTGGDADTIQLLISYFFSEKKGSFKYQSVYWRPTDEYDHFWTLGYVPGKRLSGIDLYILTSKMTFSGGEELAHNLKHFKRATLIGETTEGGGHMTDHLVLNDSFVVQMPVGRTVNIVSKTGWERTGVTPHVDVPSEEALVTAHVIALEKLVKEAANDEEKYFLEWELLALNSSLKPISVAEKTLENFTGNYGDLDFYLENGSLYCRRKEGLPNELKPLTETVFEITDRMRFEFVKDDETGGITCKLMTRDGRIEKIEKNYRQKGGTSNGYRKFH
ncbi:MAG: S41 family peptidase [Candidatus Odinarchaeota archaeon]